MEHLAAEYTEPAVVTMCGADVAATAELQARAGEPAAVTEDGQVVHSLDPETPPRWAGTISVEPGPAAPVELPVDGQLTVWLGDRSAGAAMESLTWTADEVLGLAVAGVGAPPF